MLQKDAERKPLRRLRDTHLQGVALDRERDAGHRRDVVGPWTGCIDDAARAKGAQTGAGNEAIRAPLQLQ